MYDWDGGGSSCANHKDRNVWRDLGKVTAARLAPSDGKNRRRDIVSR